MVKSNKKNPSTIVKNGQKWSIRSKLAISSKTVKKM